jgi:hypothetical protein
MSRRECLETRPGHAGYFLDGSREDGVLDYIPDGTYITRRSETQIDQVLVAYILSARSAKTSITGCLSSRVRLLFLVSVSMICLIRFLMSSSCPLSSRMETERKIKGSSTTSMLVSGQMVTQMRRFVGRDSMGFTKSDRTFSWGDDNADIFEHWSKASVIR